ncbi:lipase 3-like [Periplaneta americana]|uniref:lipase 3-like n=1 Tax=Periplaneta americana TaxID=6978 RepID=UPI0037E9814C
MLTKLLFVSCVVNLVVSQRMIRRLSNEKSTRNNVDSSSKNEVLSNVLLSTPELVRKYGYPVEEHTVQTEDGYLLTHFRIPHGRTNSTTRGRRPIILQHGLLGASDLWILMGREKSLGLILADAGFDVWLTNIRGNRHSHKHVRLSTNSAQFWNFSWHEMGVYDMPATIDHILATTGQKRLYYVGHSMGTTMFFVMTSMRPEYNDKLRLGIALAPVAFLWKPSHQLLQATIPARRQIARMLTSAGIWELFPYNKRFANLTGNMCRVGAPTHELCVLAYYIAYGDDSQQLNKTLLPVYVAHLLAGGSTKTVIHYSQIIESGKFQQFDYGPIKNKAYYGQPSAPDYDLKKITTPVSLHYGESDLVLNPEGVKYLSKQLPNVAAISQDLPRKFNHIDLVLANEGRPLVFDRILKLTEIY